MWDIKWSEELVNVKERKRRKQPTSPNRTGFEKKNHSVGNQLTVIVESYEKQFLQLTELLMNFSRCVIIEMGGWKEDSWAR